jgi:hypothetical protein
MIKKLAVLMFMAQIAGACPSGSIEWEGTCSKDIQPEIAPSVQPSDEKPPKSGMPSYQAEGVNAVMPPSCAAEDAKQDQAKAEAEAQGKRAAGLQ